MTNFFVFSDLVFQERCQKRCQKLCLHFKKIRRFLSFLNKFMMQNNGEMEVKSKLYLLCYLRQKYL